MRGLVITVLFGLTMDVTAGMTNQDQLTTDPITEDVTGMTEYPSSPLTEHDFAKPKITASTAQPKENDTFTLTCDTSKATSITWTRRVGRISSEDKLSGDNRTLTFSNVKRGDSGEYRCEAQNPVSKESSDPYTLSVAYGPDNVQIKGTLLLSIGSPITLSCSAESAPTPTYEWKVNDKVLEEKNNKLSINKAITQNQGVYMCVVRNSVTNHTANTSVHVNVTAEFTKPKITASTAQTKENDTFTLTCDTSKASTIMWTKRDAQISPEAKLSGDNRTLTFFSVKRGDSGEYRCEAQSLVSKKTSDPYTVSVAYGPDNVQIKGTLLLSIGSPITLSCSAESAPPPIYEWKVNDKVLEEKNNKLSINKVMTKNQGVYMCVVRNPVTNHTANTSVHVNVTAEFLIHKAWTVAFMAGLSFAIVLGVALGIIGSFCLYRKCRTRTSNEPTENRQAENNFYDNVLSNVKVCDETEQPKEESSYMGLKLKSGEDTYAELNT